MNEKGFVDSLMKSVKALGPSVVLRPADKFTLGTPDILAWLSGPNPPSLAIEAKQISPLMPDPFHRGRRTGQMLKHAFSGPQISMLRKLVGVGVLASGIVRVSADTAFQFHPNDLCAKTGNFTHDEMVELGRVIRLQNGVWGPLTEKIDARKIPSSGH